MTLAAGGVASVVARVVVAVLEMVWMTLWALVFGFLLSGAVQQFASAEAMQRRLGDHSWRAVARATGYGAASSSCSYAAAATSRSLLARGADAVSAFVFMVASTNLVVELGAVILGLLGWRFLAGQLAGGVALVVLLAVLGGLVLRGRVVDEARARLAKTSTRGTHDHCHGDDDASTGTGVRTLQGWSEAAGHALADVTMLRRELVVGFVLAGTLSVVVPAHAWSVLFLHGHGVTTTIENALLAPVIAALSCVCSVGNVPLAAALWRGGLGFVGTLAFLFADVLAVPLLLVYRRYYGGRLTVRLVVVLYVAIVAAALLVGSVMRALGLAPVAVHGVGGGIWRSSEITSALNVVALAVVAALLVLRARRGRVHRPPAPPGEPRVRYERAPRGVDASSTLRSWSRSHDFISRPPP